MKPVAQEELTGCGIASSAAIVSCHIMKQRKLPIRWGSIKKSNKRNGNTPLDTLYAEITKFFKAGKCRDLTLL